MRKNGICKKKHSSVNIISGLLFSLLIFISCNKDDSEIYSHSIYQPVEMDDWENSTPSSQGLDSNLILTLYSEAEALPNIYSLLIIKNNYLVAERYFNNRTITSSNKIASVTKSYISALTGIALHENIISGIDQKMAEFFPEYDWETMDSRKSDITIRQILQMRSGYPWEEFSDYHDELWARFNNWLPLISEFPLTNDPGTQFGYSNLTSHVMGIIISRAAETSLLNFAETYLCNPLDVDLTLWYHDSSGYYYGHGDMHFKSRDLAKFGTLYLNSGLYNNTQIIPGEWIAESLQPYSTDIYDNKLGSYFHNIKYGYLWWSAQVGNYNFDFAWGHGGQLIIIIQDLDMLIVTTADPLDHEFGDSAWLKTRKIIDLVGKYISSLS